MEEFKIDLLPFLARKGINQSQLAAIVGTTSSNVNKWANGNGVPSHALCGRLLLEGMTVKELFGIDLPDPGQENVDGDEFERRVKDVLVKALQEKNGV